MSQHQFELIEAAVQAIGEAAEGFLDSSKLSLLLRDRHPAAVAAVIRDAGQKAKGWLRKLLATDPRISECQVQGRHDPAFCWTEYLDAATASCAAAWSAGESRKRAAEFSLDPDAKRVKRDEPPGLDVVSEEDKTILIGAVLGALEDQPFMEGNKLSKHLTTTQAEVAERVRTALGGKGWLKRLLDPEPLILQVEVENRNEPCFRLASCTIEMPVVQPGASAAAAKQRQPAVRPAMIRPASVRPPALLAPAMVRGKGQLAAAPLNAFRPAFNQLAVQQPAAKGKGAWQQPMMPQQMAKGKGWTTPVAAPATLAAGKAAGKAACWGKGGPITPLVKGGLITPMKGALGGMGGKAGKQGKGAANSPEERIPPPPEALAELIEECVEFLSASPENSYVEGSLLSQHLAAGHPVAFQAVRNGFGGKGWLRKMIEESDGRIQKVQVEGKDEPCYALCGQVALHRGMTPSGKGSKNNMLTESQGKGGKSGKWTESQGFGSSSTIPTTPFNPHDPALQPAVFAAVEALTLVAPDYIEGNNLSKTLKANVPQLASMTLSKGWLKTILQAEPQIQMVKVEGRDEPCYRLAMPGLDPSEIVPARPSMNSLSLENGGVKREKTTKAEAKKQRQAIMPAATKRAGAGEMQASGQGPMNVTERISHEDFLTVTNAIVGFLEAHQEQGYLPGTQIVTMLRVEHPELTKQMKEALNGKGWLKNLLDLHQTIQQVQVEGVGEPCYTLALT